MNKLRPRPQFPTEAEIDAAYKPVINRALQDAKIKREVRVEPPRGIHTYIPKSLDDSRTMPKPGAL